MLEHYSLAFLDQMVAMVTAAAIMSYAIYAVNSPLIGSRMLATAPSVLYGIFRYLYLIYDRRDTRSTSAILTQDPGMIFAAVSWVGAALAMLSCSTRTLAEVAACLPGRQPARGRSERGFRRIA